MLTVKERQRVRELAMQVLFAWDAAGTGTADEAAARQIMHDGSDNPVVRQQAGELALKTWDQREMIDQRLERFAPNWPPRRQPAVDRNLLRLAVYELTNTTLPPQILIDAVIEIARQFSTSNSSAFVNGVLDAILKEHNALIAGLPPAVVEPIPAPTEGTGPGEVIE
ncbi:MAG TPA: transcription antitermination factor NusB [Tepidisphaeraceae bacterium]|jgi:N utilization substance protein B|nr:transcription antitermination factor NusB [Tepidisphaeraceae bacterium]